MKLFIILVLLFSPFIVDAQLFPLTPTVAHLRNTLYFEYKHFAGTCFIVEYKEKQYLVTARHIFDDIENGSLQKIDVLIDGKQSSDSLKVYFLPNSIVDIAVIKLEYKISSSPFRLGLEQVSYLSQECMFLGYPFGLKTYFDDSTQSIGPLVKKANYAGNLKEGSVSILLLDGHNNAGFSGGPVIMSHKGLEGHYVFAVVSGYINDRQTIKGRVGIQPMSFDYNDNSGIIRCFDIAYAEEIINSIK